MYILGISEIDNDAGAVLLKDSQVVCGLNEERLSRIKRHQGFPHRSVEWVLEQGGITLDEVDHIAITKADPELTPDRFFRFEHLLRNHRYFSNGDPSPLHIKTLNMLVQRMRQVPRSKRLALRMSGEIREWCAARGVADKVLRIRHHEAHAACSYWASGYDRALSITLDGQGEGITSEVYVVDRGKFEHVKEILLPNSLGGFYAAVTKALGFTPAKHEGKVTGLAAYATPDPKLLAAVRKLAFCDKPGSFAVPAVFGNYPRIVHWSKKYGREQIAAAFQIVLEEVATEYIAHYVKTTGVGNVCLAGGVFANVKLNQRIHQLDGVDNVFVFPHMADGGLGYGAAQIVYREKTGDMSPSPISDVYWGPGYSDEEIKKTLDRYPVRYKHHDHIEPIVAKHVADKKVVARFGGRLEFGPRALGNRSVLYSAHDPAVNDWLNAKLKRSEFMPFAPVTLAEHAESCYVGLKGVEKTAEFMTVTMDCKDKMKQQAPAVVHVDGTARPQLVRRDVNPVYHGILEEYLKITGVPCMVNTSFNMHEEPIVCTPDDGVRAYLQAELDYLAIGNFLVEAARS